MNRERTIHAFLTFIDFCVVKVIHETRVRGCWRPHKQKYFFLVFSHCFKRLTFTKYSLATSSAGLPFAPTSKFIWLISSSEIFPAN